VTPEPQTPLRRFCPFSQTPDRGADGGSCEIEKVLLPSGQQAWAIMGYHQVRDVLADRSMSSEHTHPGFPTVFPVKRQRTEGQAPSLLTYSGMDPPEHTFHRRIVGREFTDGRITQFRPRMQQIVDRHLSSLSCGPRPADLIEDLAEPITADVTSEFLGIPAGHQVAFRRLSKVLMGHGDTEHDVCQASVEFRAMLADLLARKEGCSDGGLLSRLIETYQRQGRYDRLQMVEFAGALVTAGFETTVNMIALGTVVLLRHPDRRAEMLAEPGCMRRGLEELLRYLSIADLVTARVALQGCEIAGFSIGAGDGVLALSASANHDPTIFERPDVFDIHRDASDHVAFGHGAHKCLGQHLARAELEIVFRALFREIPGLRLAVDDETLTMRDRGVILGPTAVPVTW